MSLIILVLVSFHLFINAIVYTVKWRENTFIDPMKWRNFGVQGRREHYFFSSTSKGIPIAGNTDRSITINLEFPVSRLKRDEVIFNNFIIFFILNSGRNQYQPF